jgi:type VI secretion system protein ImpE
MAAGAMDAESSLRGGDPREALHLLQDQVRARPADAKLRVFLFQLLCVLGEWERALKQLDVAATLDPGALAMAQTYREGILCELLRAQVFAGRKSPMIFGDPEAWLALLIEALLREGRGEDTAARDLRQEAYAQAPETGGVIDGQRFEWIADADMRLGPVIEAVINGRYYWVPFPRLARMVIEAPADLRDCVWMPAHLQFDNGGEAVALVPTRYPGSEASDDGAIALARKTVWEEPRAGFYCGLGQRVLGTDGSEYGLMDIRSISLGAAAETAEPKPQAG